MCIAIPMQVIEQRGLTALCRGRNGEQELNMMLIGPQPEGTWVLNYLGSAREVVTEKDAKKIEDALLAMEAVMRGEENIDIDHFFPDLADSNRPAGEVPTSEKKKNT